jgi:hypothetical protein
MSAIMGDGVLDITFRAGTSPRTTTSQYKVGYISGNNAYEVANTTTVHGRAFGVIQSFQNASSEEVTVRPLGVAKVTCNSSVTAGRPLLAIGLGLVAELAISSTALTAGTWDNIVGFAREAGSTNSVISCFVLPSMYHTGT